MLRKYKEGKNNKLLTAFGETKTMSEWALDPRGTVCAGAMCGRLRRGFSPEMAISSAKHGLRKKGNPKVISESELERRRQVAESSYRKYKKDKKVLAFGERKNLASWARDPRATVCSAAIRARLLKGITPELAISGEGWQRTARKKKAA